MSEKIIAPVGLKAFFEDCAENYIFVDPTAPGHDFEAALRGDDCPEYEYEIRPDLHPT